MNKLTMRVLERSGRSLVEILELAVMEGAEFPDAMARLADCFSLDDETIEEVKAHYDWRQQGAA